MERGVLLPCQRRAVTGILSASKRWIAQATFAEMESPTTMGAVDCQRETPTR